MVHNLKIEAKEIHKPFYKKYDRSIVMVGGINHTWSIDVVDMNDVKEYNNNTRYFINIIDILSKYVWAYPLPNKSAISIYNIFNKLFETVKPKYIWSDKGKEFYNKKFNELLTKNNIKLYSVYNENKSCIIERFNRTLKSIMYKYFHANNTYNWVDNLQKFINEYNNTIHSSTKMKPIDAKNKKYELYLLDLQQYRYNELQMKKNKNPKFQIGDYVRIAKIKNKFAKGYFPNWSIEIFRIIGIKHSYPYKYTLEDLNKEIILTTFYENELQKTNIDLKKEFIIEKILKTRIIDGKKQFLVKWKGYNDNFNSWIDESEIKDI